MKRLQASLVDVPIVDRDGYQYFIHPLTDGVPRVEPELLRDVANEIIRRIDFDGVDVILAPEAMGIHLATAVSLQVDVPVAIARKRASELPGEVSVAQATGYSENELYINGISSDDTVVVIDDVVSTGGTAKAIAEAIETIGATLERFVVIFEKRGDGDPGAPSDIPTEVLLGVAVVGETVEIISGQPST